MPRSAAKKKIELDVWVCGCQFPRAAVTDNHKFQGLKQHNVLCYNSQGQNSGADPTG